MCITPVMASKAQYFFWTVPNLPTNAAALDIHFGCEGWNPENYAPQPASMFTSPQVRCRRTKFCRKVRGLISTSRRQLSEAFAYENNHVVISRFLWPFGGYPRS